MRIIGVDLHARQQTVAMLDTETGELIEKTLRHDGNEVRKFYSALPGQVLVGIDALVSGATGRAGYRTQGRSSGKDSRSRTTQTKARSTGRGVADDGEEAAGLGDLFAVGEEKVAVAGSAGSLTKLLGCGLEKRILDAQVIKRLAVLKVLGVQNAAVTVEGSGYEQRIVPRDRMAAGKLERARVKAVGGLHSQQRAKRHCEKLFGLG